MEILIEESVAYTLESKLGQDAKGLWRSQRLTRGCMGFGQQYTLHQHMCRAGSGVSRHVHRTEKLVTSKRWTRREIIIPSTHSTSNGDYTTPALKRTHDTISDSWRLGMQSMNTPKRMLLFPRTCHSCTVSGAAHQNEDIKNEAN